MMVFGLLLGLVGTDGNTGGQRFTFGLITLADGIGFVPVAVGVFGVGEIIANLMAPEEKRSIVMEKISKLWPTKAEFKQAWPAVIRGTALGSILGVLPGGGALLASFAAYTLEKKVAKPPRSFGQGDIRGVAAPESANNAGAQTSFIPLLTLGIPSTPVMALMMGAMTIQGIAPGTAIITDRPLLFWGMIASMWLGNLLLVIINLPLVGVWVTLLRVPNRLLYPSIIVFCCIGIYSINNSPTDV